MQLQKTHLKTVSMLSFGQLLTGFEVRSWDKIINSKKSLSYISYNQPLPGKQQAYVELDIYVKGLKQEVMDKFSYSKLSTLMTHAHTSICKYMHI